MGGGGPRRRTTGLAVVAGVILLTGCGSDSSSSSDFIPTDFRPQIKEYRGQDHYRAFVSTAAAASRRRAFGSSWNQGSIDRAIDDALERCRRNAEIAESCRLHYLGDIDVSGLNDEELGRAKAVYRRNLSATIDDL